MSESQNPPITQAAQPVVIVGGGHAAAQLCASLHDAGLSEGTHLISAEATLPYQRPPLSKAFLKEPTESVLPIRPADWYDKAAINVRLNTSVTGIDASARSLALSDGSSLSYGTLVLATGTRARHWSALPNGASNALTLRTAADAEALRAQLSVATTVVVLGGGFIGLEVAATAKAMGKQVTVVEMAPRLMGRSASGTLAEHVCDAHRAQGIQVLLSASPGKPTVVDGRVTAIDVNGKTIPCDLLLLAVGADPVTELAVTADIACDNGILVDAQLRTSTPGVYAIGDVARFVLPNGQRARLESIQNANDQARTLAAVLGGGAPSYSAVPWFWSEQGSLRLQMAGLLPPEGSSTRRDGTQPTSFSVFHYDADGHLRCVESVNAPMDHMMSHKLLEAGKSPTPADVARLDVPLKNWL